MKHLLSISLSFLVTVFPAGAQIMSPATDVLGAHLNYGRGCTACHAPHSGSYGNGKAKSPDSSSGNTILWGQDVTGLYGKTITTAGNTVEVLPTSMSASTPDVNGILTCLSCHDGNLAPTGMMRNKLYETLPATYGAINSPPTLLGNSTTGAGNYMSDHPVWLTAAVNCGGAKGWDCTEANGVITMNGANSRRFVANYGLFVQLSAYNGKAVVTCTTCHNQHQMNVVHVTSGSTSGLPEGNYATMFFLRGPYNPNDTNPMSNQTSQFCRQCHADMSNEMNGGTVGTIF